MHRLKKIESAKQPRQEFQCLLHFLKNGYSLNDLHQLVIQINQEKNTSCSKDNVQLILNHLKTDFKKYLLFLAFQELTMQNYITLFHITMQYVTTSKNSLQPLIQQKNQDFKQSMLNIVIHFSLLLAEKIQVTIIRKLYIQKPFSFALQIKLILRIFLSLESRKMVNKLKNNDEIIEDFFIPFLKISNKIDHIHEGSLQLAELILFQRGDSIIEQILKQNIKCCSKGRKSALKYLNFLKDPFHIRKTLELLLSSEELIKQSVFMKDLFHFLIKKSQKMSDLSEEIVIQLQKIEQDNCIKTDQYLKILEIYGKISSINKSLINNRLERILSRLKVSNYENIVYYLNYITFLDNLTNQQITSVKSVMYQIINDKKQQSQYLDLCLSTLIKMQKTLEGKWKILLTFYQLQKCRKSNIYQSTIEEIVSDLSGIPIPLQSKIIIMFIYMIKKQDPPLQSFYLNYLSNLITHKQLIKQFKDQMKTVKSKKKQKIMDNLNRKFKKMPQIAEQLNNL